MKKILNKIKKSLHNTGSSLILVIVALAFIGILTGALLTAVGYVYRQKLYDYNARSNFYYLDQAMDEIYSSLGAMTMNDLMEAYQKTREQIITFDPDKKTYVNMDEADANQLFKDNFAKEIAQDADFTTANIKTVIKNSITNSTIELVDDASKPMMVKYVYIVTDASNNPKPVYKSSYSNTDDASKLAKIVIQNVILRRTASYERSTAKGTFQQTIATDIEITRPDFNISFGNNTIDINNLFEFSVIADSGVDFDRISKDILTISGNVYAANDFYNKEYNNYVDSKQKNTYSATITDDAGKVFKMNKVSNYNYQGNNTLFNTRSNSANRGTLDPLFKENNLYDGKNDRSKYSGLYIDGGRVSILADKVIVPGSIAVMNGGSIAVYGINGGDLSATNVWADEVVLDGYSLNTTNAKIKEGPSAVFNSNLYVKDDTTINSEFSRFKLDGSYYGFGNTEKKDERAFIPTTAKQKDTDRANIYQEIVGKDTSGNDVIENRGHYNSSAIIVNGQHTTLDLSTTKKIFIAGRSYIELSNTKLGTTTNDDIDPNKGRVAGDKVSYKTSTYQYDPKIGDYRTGESISVKSSQLAYYPNKASGKMLEVQQNDSNNSKGYFAGDYFELASTSKLKTMALIKKYFGDDGLIPISKQEEIINPGTTAEKKKEYHYIDFEQAVRNMKFSSAFFTTLPTTYNSTVEGDISKYADILKQRFIKDYFDYFNFCVNADSVYKLAYLGYEDGYDDSSYAGNSYLLTPTEFATKYPDTDTNILESRTGFDRTEIDKKALELQNVTEYSDFIVGQIAVPDATTGINSNDIFTSGAVTRSDKLIDSTISSDKNVEFTVMTDNDSVITSILAGDTSNTSTEINTTTFVENTGKHYNYMKMILADVPDTSNEAALVNQIVQKNGEGGLTPINYYMNYDKLAALTSDITPSNLDLGQYNVWASKGDVTIKKSDVGSAEVTGIVIAMGDVYFDQIEKFNGLIMTGGKVYIGTNNEQLTNLSATSLCRNIMNEVLSKASVYDATKTDDNQTYAENAVKFLSLFKAYEDVAEKAKNGDYKPDETARNVTSIDYSDVIKYNNWMRNVED